MTKPWPAWREKLVAWHKAESVKRQAALRRKRRLVADERLYQSRTCFGRVELRLVVWVHTRRRPRPLMEILRGQAFRIAVPEVIDAWEFLRDFDRFNRAWRPMRLRTEPQQAATRELFDQWERLGAVVEPGRWG